MHDRKSIRYKNWDYGSEGAYYITICTSNMIQLFGKVHEGKMFLNKFGEVIRNEWINTPELRKNVVLDEFIIMPNHFHAVLIITENLGRHTLKLTNKISEGVPRKI